jgi:hypothetical protein
MTGAQAPCRLWEPNPDAAGRKWEADGRRAANLRSLFGGPACSPPGATYPPSCSEADSQAPAPPRGCPRRSPVPSQGLAANPRHCFDLAVHLPAPVGRCRLASTQAAFRERAAITRLCSGRNYLQAPAGVTRQTTCSVREPLNRNSRGRNIAPDDSEEHRNIFKGALTVNP